MQRDRQQTGANRDDITHNIQQAEMCKSKIACLKMLKALNWYLVYIRYENTYTRRHNNIYTRTHTQIEIRNKTFHKDLSNVVVCCSTRSPVVLLRSGLEVKPNIVADEPHYSNRVGIFCAESKYSGIFPGSICARWAVSLFTASCSEPR